MTNTRKCFQQQISPNSLPQNACRSVEECHQNDKSVESRANYRHHSITTAKSSSREQTRACDGSKVEKSKPLRDIVNCRKLLDWSTASSVRKLLPIFILVNMLPFLYAGESEIAFFSCMPISVHHQKSRWQLPEKCKKKIE
jgi:hypothetical protein